MIGLLRTPRRMEDLALFSHHVGGAMAARVPLHEILSAYVEDCEYDQMRAAVADLAESTRRGAPLADSMEAHPTIFPAAYRRLVRVGEQAHALPVLMRRTADRIESSLRTYEQFRRQAAYPLMLLVGLFTVVSFLVYYGAPKQQDIFHELGAELGVVLGGPFGLTLVQMTMIFNLLLVAPMLYLLLLLLGLRHFGIGQGRFALSIPVIGPLMRLSETADFASNLSLLLENRIPLDEALKLLEETSSNRYVRFAIADFQDRANKGESLGSMMRAQPLFPSSMAVMIASSEQHGELAETLDRLGRFYRERVTHGLLLLRELVEPLMLLLIGLMIAMVLAAVYYPLFLIPHLIR